jgi:CheY-like chemotaxis protein
VVNLLSNAVKFTPRGGRIGVRLEREGATAKLRVEDNGCGISPELLPHIFDRFRQGEGSTTRQFGGLGLGLAIVRHLVEAHGGTVVAESPGEGRGATLTVTLPLVSAKRPALEPDRAELQPRASTAGAALQGLRVLVVDDDPDTCELLGIVLREEGADVHTVQSVRAAVADLAPFRPHVLLSDVGMPQEDGYALIRRIREQEAAEGGHIPAVALTAFASPADHDHALAVGFDVHLAKPVSPRNLKTAVLDAIGRGA